MRPGRHEVTTWFVGDLLSDERLASYIGVLNADPNWRLVEMDGASVRTLRLLYFPDGVPFDVVLDRTSAGWQPRVA